MAEANGSADGQPEKHCPNCQKFVMPLGKGQCPQCGRPLLGSFLARRGPTNKLRVEQHEKEITAEFLPTTSVARFNAKLLAAARERIESTKPGTPEWDRLATRIQQLTAVLEDSRRTCAAQPLAFENATNEELIAKLESLLAFAKETQALSVLVERRQAEDRERTGQLAAARAIQPADVQIPLANAMPDASNDESRALQPESPATQPADEASILEEQAEIRRKLGWNSVQVEHTNRRYRE